MTPPAICRLLLATFWIISLVTSVLCGVSKDQAQLVKGTEGESATLQLIRVTAEDIANITWIRHHNHIITTEPGDVISVRDPLYTGRVSATQDGSLVIMSLNLTDNGPYSASVLLTTGDTRPLHYTLHVDRANSSVGRLLVNTMLIAVSAVVAILVAGCR